MGIISKIKYFFKGFDYLRVFNSPFIKPKLKFYFGKIQHGTPYFFPRRWIKLDRKHAEEFARKEMEKMTPEWKERYGWNRIEKSFEDLVEEGLRHLRAVPKLIGFDFVSLGWKTKWDENDIRFEWGPLISFVFFKWQFCIMFRVEHLDHYWSSWIYYDKRTDKSKSKVERLKDCMKNFPQIWTTYSKDERKVINYYELILKDKYKKYIEDVKVIIVDDYEE